MRRVRRAQHVFQPLRLAFHPCPLKRRVSCIHVRLDPPSETRSFRSSTYLYYELFLRSDDAYLKDAPFSPPASTQK
jgi:hypothetical protein